MTRKLAIPSLIAAALMLLPITASAHTGVGDPNGIAHGFLHPVSGLDHILAMVMVGVLAWQLGGRALWLLPASFVASMCLGGVIGVAGIPLPFVEIGIAMSVVVLGAVVAGAMRAPLATVMGLVGLFAIFHGHAHGSEMPENISGLAYAMGFIAATALLHIAGICAGVVLGRAGDRYGTMIVRAAGAASAVAGVGILVSAI